MEYIHRLVPGSEHSFPELKEKHYFKSSSVYINGRKVVRKTWKLDAINCPRYIFDDYLLQAVKSKTSTTIFEGKRVRNTRKENGIFTLLDEKENIITRSRSIILAVGANSELRNALINKNVDISGYGVAVSQYFENLSLADNQNHFFLSTALSYPGYFWAFPFGQKRFNVGFGALTKSKQNVKSDFERVIEKDKHIKKIFERAIAVGPIRGHKLPFPSFSWPLGHDGVLVIGDSAELMDPLLGHGIDKAILSGILAAEVLDQAFKNNDLSWESLKNYEARVSNEIYPELKSNKRWLNFLWPFMRIASLF